MSHTYKDQLRYRAKHNLASYSYLQDIIGLTGRRDKKIWARTMNRRLRHRWKLGLKKGETERLNRKSDCIDWIIW